MIRANSISMFLGGLLLSAAFLVAEAPLPVTILNPGYLPSLQGAGFTEYSLSSAGFRTSAMVQANNGYSSAQDASRGQMQTTAVYAGMAQKTYSMPSTPGPAYFGMPTAIYDFKQSSDAAQAWATMQSNGMPFIDLLAMGKATCTGAVSWKASLTAPAAGQHVFVYMTIPQVQIAGVNEQNSASRWQSKFQAELLLNGHPVWNSEAVRSSLLSSNAYATKYTTIDYSIQNPGSGVSYYQLASFLATFGDAVTLDPSFELSLSPVKPVLLDLGVFPPSQTVELTFTTRLDSQAFSACHFDSTKNEWFCSRGESSLSWENTAAPVRFFAGHGF